MERRSVSASTTDTVAEFDRTVTPLKRSEGEWRRLPSRRLSDFREVKAFVLLGDPGSGKTHAFKQAEADSEGCYYTTARRFNWSCAHRPEELRGKTLFIDGLDEKRLVGNDPRTPMDETLSGLRRLGSPRVRISCRAADWLTTDYQELRNVYDGRVQLLQLDPLSPDQRDSILQHLLRDRDEDPLGFRHSAAEHGLEDLLNNPLSLKLLVAATSDGWPDSRHEVFEKACGELAKEENSERQDVERFLEFIPSKEDLLETAGGLSALLLLADKEEICRHRGDRQRGECLSMEDVKSINPREARAALNTRLFSFVPPDCFVPIHRHIAEFLAARYLLGRISAGVPADRVMALMAGGDGTVVWALRGLSAWLALLPGRDGRPSLPGRVMRRLIDTDPLAILSHGDASAFSGDQKAELLASLGRRHEEVRDLEHVPGPAAAVLLSPETIGTLKGHLATPGWTASQQMEAELLLKGLARAAPSSLKNEISSNALLEAARDSTLPRIIRVWAMEAATNVIQSHNADTEPLASFLDDIKDGGIEDADNQLRGSLLLALYPKRITAGEVWRYLPPPREGGILGLNEVFWSRCIEEAKDDDIEQLLDNFPALGSPFRGDSTDWLNTDVWKLLARWLQRIESHQSDRSLPQLCRKLYEWIMVAAYDRQFKDWLHPLASPPLGPPFDEHDWPKVVQAKLYKWPDIHRPLILEFIRRFGSDAYGADLSGVQVALRAQRFAGIVLGNSYPPGFSEWCIEQSVKEYDKECSRSRKTGCGRRPDAAQILLGWGIEDRRSNSAPGAWLNEVSRVVCGRTGLIEYLQEVAEGDKERRRREDSYRTRRREREKKLVRQVREHEEVLVRGRPPWALLSRVARAYLGVSPWSEHPSNERQADEDRGRARLRAALDFDDCATEIALNGLRRTLERRDLPGLAEVVKVRESAGRYMDGYPVRAGLEILSWQAEESVSALDDKIIKSALGFYFLAPPRYGRRPPRWFRCLLESNRDIVAEVFISVHRSLIRKPRGETIFSHLDTLARGKYDAIAPIVVPSLLRAIPMRATTTHSNALQKVLRAAVRCNLTDDLEERIEDRLAKDNIDVAQRAAWLAAGFSLSPQAYIARVIQFLHEGKPAVRTRHFIGSVAAVRGYEVGGRIYQAEEELAPAGKPDADEMADLVRLVATQYPPWFPLAQHDTERWCADQLVEYWMNQLAAVPEPKAGSELEQLLSPAEENRALKPWAPTFRAVRDRQIVLRRNATYEVPSPADIEATLRNEKPANAADLATTVASDLEELAGDIRHANINGWKQYWNVDGYGRCKSPRPENTCRDALLFVLREKRPFYNREADAQPEGQYAGDQRADIRVSYRSVPHEPWAVPVEIKRNSNPGLWSAVQGQLIPYTRDPESGGYGIYVVLWFGIEWVDEDGNERKRRRQQRHPDGRSAETPEAVKELLEEGLSREQRRKIRIVVVDVSDPKASRSSV